MTPLHGGSQEKQLQRLLHIAVPSDQHLHTMEPQSPFKPDTLRGKTALVTGGGSGIGLEITRQLGEAGLRG